MALVFLDLFLLGRSDSAPPGPVKSPHKFIKDEPTFHLNGVTQDTKNSSPNNKSVNDPYDKHLGLTKPVKWMNINQKMREIW